MGKRKANQAKQRKDPKVSKQIIKQKSTQQHEELSENEQRSLFKMLMLNDPQNLERALLSLATISFTSNSPQLLNFYSKDKIERLLQVVDQLESRTSYYALDAIR